MPGGTHLVCRNLPPDISPFQISVPSRQSLVVLMMARCSSATTIRKHGKIYYLLFTRPRNSPSSWGHIGYGREKERAHRRRVLVLFGSRTEAQVFQAHSLLLTLKHKNRNFKAQGRKKTSVPYPRLSTSTQMLKQRSLGSQKFTVKAYTAGTSQKW